jgi:Saxitoxin biosynthesis operon protein SxtJ
MNDIPPPSDRSFGLTFTAVFGILAGLAFWRDWMRGDLWLFFLATSAAFLLFSLTLPRILRPFNKAWMLFGAVMHKVVSPIMLGLIYFGVMSPVSLFFKLTGRDELRRKFNPVASTYWIPREPPGPDGPSSFPRQF